MITLCILAYIIISVYFSIQNMRFRQITVGEWNKPQKPKQAFINGFLKLPLMIIIPALCILIIYGLIIGFFNVIAWMVTYLP